MIFKALVVLFLILAMWAIISILIVCIGCEEGDGEL